MRILLDTHVYLWWCEDSYALSLKARTIIEEAETVYVSSATLWELAIKIGIGKFEGNINDLARNIQASGFEELPVKVAHTIALPGLASHHKDPFDRMLIAQAISEPLQLITHDAVLTHYTPLVSLV
jgi:PIN domain nuclease of toxin-antitoxin system